MRLLLLPTLLLLGGCSTFDGARFAPRADVSTIYLDAGETIMVQNEENRELYGCRGAPIFCDRWGTSWRCGCPF